MTVADNVKLAKNPQAAMLALAEGIDELLGRLVAPAPTDLWGEWKPGLDAINQRALEVQQVGEDEAVVQLAPVSEAKQQLRREFAQDVLHLDEALGEGEDWITAYAKGGPLWLYHGNRDLVLQYDAGIRAEMVRDVTAEDPEVAHEMGRDILKDAQPGTFGEWQARTNG